MVRDAVMSTSIRNVSEKIVNFFTHNGMPLTSEQSILADRAVAVAMTPESEVQDSFFDFIPQDRPFINILMNNQI